MACHRDDLPARERGEALPRDIYDRQDAYTLTDNNAAHNTRGSPAVLSVTRSVATSPPHRPPGFSE
ncbi:hypothetical protein GCM10022214_00840 [Actinomadura miaoliensis]|uniref:Uncharacterized protein n=1 Tax=Actinomadura miaoliensis TaxID=430685 RepID=A0ABP7UW66_9ACTN